MRTKRVTNCWLSKCSIISLTLWQYFSLDSSLMLLQIIWWHSRILLHVTRKKSYRVQKASYKVTTWLLMLPIIMYSVIDNKIKGTYNNNFPYSKLYGNFKKISSCDKIKRGGGRVDACTTLGHNLVLAGWQWEIKKTSDKIISATSKNVQWFLLHTCTGEGWRYTSSTIMYQ